MKKMYFLLFGVLIGMSVCFIIMYFIKISTTHTTEYNYEIVDMDDKSIKRYLSENSYTNMLEEMRQYKNCSNPQKAFEEAMRVSYFQQYAPDEGKIYVTHDSEECLYIVVFPLKDSEYVCRVIIDEYTSGILQIAKIR